jgi:hypothetical protein
MAFNPAYFDRLGGGVPLDSGTGSRRQCRTTMVTGFITIPALAT